MSCILFSLINKLINARLILLQMLFRRLLRAKLDSINRVIDKFDGTYTMFASLVYRRVLLVDPIRKVINNVYPREY